jgi:hypothetical protein
MAFVVEKDEPLDPMSTGFLGPRAVMARADSLARLDREVWVLKQSSVQSSGGCVRVDFCSEDILWRFPCCLLPWSVQVTWQLVRKHVLPYTEVVNATDADMLQQTLKN